MILTNPPREKAVTVVFDLDGTLTHSSPDIAAALNAALAPYDSHVSVAETERMIGGGLSMLLSRALELTSLELSESETRAVFDRLLAAYRASPAKLTRLHDWVAEALTALSHEGARIAICTNKTEDITLQILGALGVTRRIHAVVGQAEGRSRKPDAEPLLLAIERAGGNVSRSVMVGDSGADVGAARAAGVPVILVPHGYGTQNVWELDGDRVVSNARELQEAVAALIGT